MKKLLAFLLLVIMLTSLMAPAYATDIDETAYSAVFDEVRAKIRSNDYYITGKDGNPTNDISEAYYTFHDIDGNGVKELIFATYGDSGIIYTLADGKGVELVYWSGYRDRYIGINELGYMHGEGSSSAYSGESKYYCISEDGKSSQLVAKIEYEYNTKDDVVYTVTTPQETRTMSESELNRLLALIKRPDINLDDWKVLTDEAGTVPPSTGFSDAIGGFATSPKLEYSTGVFKDINENLWYGANEQAVIKRAYEFGIMNGKGKGIFDPGGTLTLAEAIKMAATVHSIYNGGNDTFTQGSPWYQVYVDYAISSGIIGSNAFSRRLNNAANRAEIASIFAGSVPSTVLQEINTVSQLPDVLESSFYGKDIFRLYRAGVLTGNDSQGTFKPSSNMTRAEASAIICRIVIPSERRIVHITE